METDGMACTAMAIKLEKLYWLRHILHRREMSGLMLYRGQLPMMEYIGAYPGCTQVQVAQTLLISPSSVAQSTKRMQREGLIEKRVEEENQRIKRLYLTPAGHALMLRCRACFNEVDAQVFSQLDGEELAQLDRLISKALKAVAARSDLDVESMDMFAFMKLKRGWYDTNPQ